MGKSKDERASKHRHRKSRAERERIRQKKNNEGSSPSTTTTTTTTTNIGVGGGNDNDDTASIVSTQTYLDSLVEGEVDDYELEDYQTMLQDLNNEVLPVPTSPLNTWNDWYKTMTVRSSSRIPGSGNGGSLFSVSEDNEEDVGMMFASSNQQHVNREVMDLRSTGGVGRYEHDDSDLDDSTHSNEVDWWQAQSLSSFSSYRYMFASGNEEATDFTSQSEQGEREKWGKWAIQAMEIERQRRMRVNAVLENAESVERTRRRQWALDAIEQERNDRISSQFLNGLTATNWFHETISTYQDDYELVCPYYKLGVYFSLAFISYP